MWAPASPPHCDSRQGLPASRLPKPPGGIYLSDDAGATWRLVNDETRLWGRGWYFESVTVDPDNPDKAYVINTADVCDSGCGQDVDADQGRTRGDDYHQLWVNPRDGSGWC